MAIQRNDMVAAKVGRRNLRGKVLFVVDEHARSLVEGPTARSYRVALSVCRKLLK